VTKSVTLDLFALGSSRWEFRLLAHSSFKRRTADREEGAILPINFLLAPRRCEICSSRSCHALSHRLFSPYRTGRRVGPCTAPDFLCHPLIFQTRRRSRDRPPCLVGRIAGCENRFRPPGQCWLFHGSSMAALSQLYPSSMWS